MSVEIREQTWEYRVFHISPKAVDLAESLDRFGLSRWELVAAVPVVESFPGGNAGVGTRLMLIFKRPRQD